MRILIAEDSAIERVVLQEAVEGLGHDCRVAADGTEAWDLFQREGADVVVTDWLMPGLEGPELCRRIRAQAAEAASYPYLILLTALDDRESMLAGMAAGADDYLTKPLAIDGLEAHLVAASRVTGLYRQLAAAARDRERALARREAVLRLARQLAAEADRDRVLTRLLSEATVLLGGSAGLVSRWDERQRVLAPVRSTIQGVAEPGVPSLAREASSQAVLRRTTVTLDGPAAADACELRAAAAAPLVYAGRLLGTLTVGSCRPDAHFGVEDLDVLREVADIGAATLVGLERARAEGSLLVVSALGAAPAWVVGGGGRPAGSLPVQATPLVGRERELALVSELLQQGEVQLVTLSGPAGIGKSRLALAVASHLQETFEQPVLCVDLQPVRYPSQVLAAVAHALGARGDDEPLAWLRRELGGRPALLVLDNFEHLVAAAPELAALLEACPRLKALVTSREVLRLRAEHDVPVPLLEVPDAREPMTVERLARVPTVALFVQRAQAADLTFALTESNMAAVAELCRRLDGLPLAIELAAARSRTLPPEAIRSRLEQESLSVLSGGARDQAAHHKTLQTAIAWSYDPLVPEEQRLFRQLGVFAGGFTLEVAMAVCAADAGNHANGIVEPIASLVAKSLVIASVQPDGQPRYRMLETIRQFALEQLTSAGELRAALDRHARFYLEVAERAEAGSTGRDQGVWLDRLEWEYQNLVAALRWAVRQQELEFELRLCGALGWFWLARGDEAEGRQLVEATLERARNVAARGEPSVSVAPVAAALLADARLAAQMGDWRVARQLHERRVGLVGPDAASLVGIAQARWCLSERGAARSLAGDALAVATEQADCAGRVCALRVLGEIATARGDLVQAAAQLAESLAGWDDLHDRLLLARCLEACAALAAVRTHGARALRLYGAASSLRAAVGAPLRGSERAEIERWLAQARASLPGDEAAAAEAEGRGWSPEQAIAAATAQAEPRVIEPDPGQLRPLSDREAQIATLVARGWTNARIGVELRLSERTIEAHVRRIIHRLGFASRTQLATWVVQRIGQPSSEAELKEALA